MLISNLALLTLAVALAKSTRLPESSVPDSIHNLVSGADTVVRSLEMPNQKVFVPLKWVGQAFANGPNVTIVGQDVYAIVAQLRVLNPDFDSFNIEQTSEQRRLSGLTSAKRESHDIVCNNPRFEPGDKPAFAEGIQYLRGLSGFCIVDGPKDSCNRCSCSWNTGIWMCNDSTRGVTHQYMYCWDMGDKADQVAATCQFWGSAGNPKPTGQYFRHDTEYSILLAGGARC